MRFWVSKRCRAERFIEIKAVCLRVTPKKNSRRPTNSAYKLVLKKRWISKGAPLTLYIHLHLYSRETSVRALQLGEVDQGRGIAMLL